MNESNEPKHRLSILMLGSKDYPYGASADYEPYVGGGTENYVNAISEGLSNNGFDIHMIVRRFPNQKKQEQVGNITIYRVPFIKGKYARLPSFNFFSVIFAMRLMKKIDIIHTHGPIAAFFGMMLGKIYRKKVVSTLHGLPSLQIQNKFNKVVVWAMKTVERIAYSNVYGLVFLSKQEKDIFEANVKIPERVKRIIILPGINPVKASPKKREDKSFNVAYIGRLVAMKGVDKFIQSYEYLPKSLKGKMKYIIVGGGYLEKELKELALKQKNSADIIFTGYTNNIGEYLNKSDLFILPSEGGEGLPCALLEAFSIGIPCIVSNCDLPIADDAMYTMKDNQPQTIADTLAKLHANLKARKALGKKCHQEFMEKFTFNRVVNDHMQLYESVANLNNEKPK